MEDIEVKTEFIIAELERRQVIREKARRMGNQLRVIIVILVISIINFFIVYKISGLNNGNKVSFNNSGPIDSLRIIEIKETIFSLKAERFEKSRMMDTLSLLLTNEISGKGVNTLAGHSSGLRGYGPRAKRLEQMIIETKAQIEELNDSIDYYQKSLR
jgi:hypothetical protein